MQNLEKLLAGIALAAVVGFSTATVTEAGFNEAVAAYEAGDYELAFDEWLPLVKKRDR